MANKLKFSTQKSKIYFLIIFYIFLLFIVSSNIYSSQTISPLYSQLVNEKYDAVVAFAKKIRLTPEFSFFLKTNKKIYGVGVEADVFAQESRKKQEINQLESFLQKNPKARDILVRLSALYKKLGNEIKAEEYLKKAKEIDPSVK